MLGTMLHFFRPTYALTALILFGGWQGYAFVRSVPEKLGLPFGTQQAQPDDTAGGGDPTGAVEPSNRLIAGLRQSSALGRAAVWVVGFSLLTLACVPLIRKILAQESNTATAAMVAAFVALGLLAAMTLAAFEFGWRQIIFLIAAGGYALCLTVWLAGEVEKMRISDTLSCS